MGLSGGEGMGFTGLGVLDGGAGKPMRGRSGGMCTYANTRGAAGAGGINLRGLRASIFRVGTKSASLDEVLHTIARIFFEHSLMTEAPGSRHEVRPSTAVSDRVGEQRTPSPS